jgi:PEP-CTERM motif
MNRRHDFLRCFFALLGFWWGLQSAICQAISYTITIDTIPLATQPTPPGPFALDFQFIDGDGTMSNTVRLSNFDFGPGGGPTGSPNTMGGATGNLTGTVTLTDSSFFNEFIQGFTPGTTTPLSFLLDITGNVEPTIPDAFSLAIFDSSGAEIPTSFADAFLQIDLTHPLTINTYASDTGVAPRGCPTCPPIALTAPTVELTAPVPEPGTLLLLISGVVGTILFQRRLR